MNTMKVSAAVAALTITALSASAQLDESQEEALRWATPDATRPSLTVKPFSGNVLLGVGGTVKVTGNFDFGDPVDNPDQFLTSSIPLEREEGSGSRCNFSARQTGIYLAATILPDNPNRVGVYVNFNLLGDHYEPTLQYAYLKWRNLTAGYAYTVFSDNDANVPTIDYQGPNAFTGIQNTVINWEQPFGSWQWGIGIDAPMLSAEPAGACRTVAQRVPDVPAYLQYNFGDGHVRASAIVRNLYYRNEARQHNIDRVGWGVKLSGNVPLLPGLSGVFQALYGEGITSYYQDLTDCGLDLVGTTTGAMKPLRSWGGFAGLVYNPIPRVTLSGAYSHIRLYPGADGLLPELDTTYKYAQYAVGTAMYNFTDYLAAGVEYIYGRRVQPDGSQRHDSRIMVGAQLSF